MTRFLSIGFIILVYLFFAVVISANTIHIPSDFQDIQQGIDASQDGDTVLVEHGLYYENINFRGKSIVVTSRYGLDGDVAHIISTTIDGSTSASPDTGSCAILVSGEDQEAILQGFTLTGGTGTSFYFGAGMGSYREGGCIILSNSSATIRNNLIIDNEAVVVPGVYGGGGGGISSMSGNPRILNNVIMLNSAPYASGIVLNWSGGIIRNNIIYRNHGADQFGTAGIMVWEQGPAPGIIENNTIVGNISLMDAGGISVTNTSAVIRNNIVWGNRQQSGNQVTGHQNSTFDYCSAEENYAGEGMIYAYPEFHPSEFLLESSSPCIDAGYPNASYDDAEDPENSGLALFPSLGGIRNDIGAYGGPGATVLPVIDHEYLRVPEHILFPTVEVGDSVMVQREILNLSTRSMSIDSIAVDSPSEVLLLSRSIEEEAIHPIQSDTLEIIWMPNETGSLRDTLRLYHDLSTLVNPVIVPISGTAEAPAGSEDDRSLQIPGEFHLHQSHPNPFSCNACISYDLPDKTFIRLTVYDIAGQEVRTLVEGFRPAGHGSVVWDGKDHSGVVQSSGIYIYRLVAGDESFSRRLLLLK